MTFSYKYDDTNKFCFPYSYTFTCSDFETYFYQAPSGDLGLTTVSQTVGNKTMEIRKDEDYQLFMILDDFYTSLAEYKEKYGYRELFETGIFSWKSDAPANELSIYGPFIFNYLNIVKENDVYKLELINNIKENRFTVEFNTDRSRYGALVFAVFTFFKRLSEIDLEYHQITIDEYLYKKDLTNRKNNHTIS